MSSWRDAVQEVPGGVRLLVEVAANARAGRFPDDFNPWRDGRIGVRVCAPAQEGRANAEACATVAAFFGVPGGRVELEAGAADARKALLVRGVAREAVLDCLAPLLEPS
ncbi:MAG: uncharacterized protein QOD77_319 [Thermoplasmata archaeon]|jgi:uncharacterized protein (TIGR00251 family)|nr:uncharacterized protein [Thermoplasmata archaeon]